MWVTSSFEAQKSQCQIGLRKTKVKLDLLTDIDILLMVEE